MRYQVMVFAVLGIILAGLGYYILYPYSVTYDPAMHAEIVRLIGIQGYVQTWEPYAQNPFTYPPFFHYLGFVLWVLGLSLADAVRILGILVFISLGPSMYALVKSYRGSEIASLSAGIGLVLIPLTATIFILGEFPELLALELIILLLYFMKTKREKLVALTAGLIVITHPFMTLVGGFLFLCYGIRKLDRKPKNILIYVLVFLIVIGFWIPQYLTITWNALTGQWHNVIYIEQPFLWFWPIQDIGMFLFGLNYLTPILIPLSLIGLYRFKDRFLRSFYLFCLVFTIFHLPYTQLKILDLFVIPIAIFAGFGVDGLSHLFKVWRPKGKHYMIPLVVFLVIMAGLQASHFAFAKRWYPDSNITPTEGLAKAGIWLRDFDPEFARIYTEQAPAWMGLISNKLPMDPQVTDLERYSEEYLEQLGARERIMDFMSRGEGNIEDLLEEWDIKYIISTKEEHTDYLEGIYSQGGWNVYIAIKIS